MKIFTRFSFFSFSLVVALMLLTVQETLGQTTVFSDDFSTNTSATYSTSGAIGSSAFSVSRSGADWGARRNTSPAQLEISNDIGATANVAGWAFASTPLSGFTAPYNATLSSNTGIVTWTFNMRSGRTSALAGFSTSTNYGMAVILGATSTTANNAGNGYAVVMGGGTSNAIGLISYTGGLQGTRSTVIAFGNTPTALTDYLSVKVTYDPSTNAWELLSRDDGSTVFADPALGSLTSIGTATNSTYTGTAMSSMGAYFQGSTGAGQAAFFDNFKIAVATPGTTSIGAGAGAEPSTISALTNTQGAASLSFDIAIQDDGATPATDALPTKISQLVFTQGTGNDVANWTLAAAGAELSDGTTTMTGTVGATSISFPSIDIATLGLIADNATKTYTLKVWLKSDMTTLKTTIDGLNLVFRIQTSGVTADATGSQLAVSQDQNSGANNNAVTVAATTLGFVTQPTITSPNATMSPAVTVSANDANGNRDLDYITAINITSSGTLTGSPVVSTPTVGLATFSSLTHTATGTGFQLTAAAVPLSNGTSITFDIAISSSSADYFRSAATGDWATAATWESAPDNMNWITSTLVPTSAANVITIRNGHTITISTALTIDDVVIPSGGTLVVNSTTGTLNLNNGAAANDMDIQNGGIMQVIGTAAYTATILVAAGGNINVATGGKITVGNGIAVGSSYNTFATSALITWNDGAIFEWNATTTPGASGVTFFPNNVSTAPILRVSANWGTPGGGLATIINGKIEVNSPFTWNGSGVKTFRNGIIGTATMSQSTTGAWTISGTTAELGGGVTLSLGASGCSIISGVTITGTGTLTIAGTGTLTVGSNTTLQNLTMTGGTVATADGTTLTINGILTLTSGKITLGATGTGNVVIGSTGSITGGSSSSYIATTGTGTLTKNSLSTSMPTTFPVGTASTYDPCTIQPSNAVNFSVNVGTSFATMPLAAAQAAARVWGLSHSATPGACALTFTSSVAPTMGAPNTDPPATSNAVLGHFNGATWEEFKYVSYAAGTWSMAQYNGTFSPFGVGTTGAFASVALTVDFTAISATNKGTANIVTFATANEKDLTGYKIERSTNGTEGWSTIGEVKAKSAGDYTFTDASPLIISYYRVKGIEYSGKEIVSKIVSVARSKSGTLKVYPSLATDKLTVSLDNPDSQPYIIFDFVGKIVQSGQVQGQKDLIINTLSAGTYILKVGTETAKFYKN